MRDYLILPLYWALGPLRPECAISVDLCPRLIHCTRAISTTPSLSRPDQARSFSQFSFEFRTDAQNGGTGIQRMSASHPCQSKLTIQASSGFLEGIVRGYKAGLLTSGAYHNLTQCENLEGESFFVQRTPSFPLNAIATTPSVVSPILRRCSLVPLEIGSDNQTSECNSLQQTMEIS